MAQSHSRAFLTRNSDWLSASASGKGYKPAAYTLRFTVAKRSEYSDVLKGALSAG
jgi:hypothetical protein